MPGMNDRKNDEMAISALLQALVEAWGRGDGEAFGAVFTEDADYVAFNGYHMKGRQQIAAVHQQLFDTVLKGTRLGGGDATGSATTLRFLTPDVALFHSSGGVRWPGQEKASAEQNSVQTFVLVKQDGQWRITAFQNTRIQPLPPPGGSGPPP
jgi:uncharacterized protein (TIGR02246 family)